MNLVIILNPLNFVWLATIFSLSSSWTSLINLFSRESKSPQLQILLMNCSIKENKRHLCIIINQVRTFICFARPMSHLYQDISVVVILMCGVTCGFCGQTATEADQSAGQRKGKKLSSFTKLYIPRNITHLSQNIKKLKLKLKKLEPTWLCELLKKHFIFL